MSRPETGPRPVVDLVNLDFALIESRVLAHLSNVDLLDSIRASVSLNFQIPERYLHPTRPSTQEAVEALVRYHDLFERSLRPAMKSYHLAIERTRRKFYRKYVMKRKSKGWRRYIRRMKAQHAS